MTTDNRNSLIERTLFKDPTGGMIYQRILAQFTLFLQHSNLTEAQRESVRDLLVVICLKYTAIWIHDQRYEKHEKELIAEALKNPVDRRSGETIAIATAQDLYIELDGFLVQVKSLLDHMVHILHYTHGLDFSGLTTFGDHGNRIINQLKGSVSKKVPGLVNAAKLLVDHVEQNQWWLKVVIESRDRMNHYMHGGLSPLAFTVVYAIDADGVPRMYRPMIYPGRTLKDEMTVISKSLFDFVEYFIGIAIVPRMLGCAIKFNRTEDVNKAQWEFIDAASVKERTARGEVLSDEIYDL